MKKYRLNPISDSMRYTTDVSFETMEEIPFVTLEDSETMSIFEPDPDEIRMELVRLQRGDIDFVIITLPRTTRQVRYIQICMEGTRFLIQAAVEKDHCYHLVEKRMNRKEGIHTAVHFSETGEVSVLGSFTKVEFRRSPSEMLQAARNEKEKHKKEK